MVNIFSAKNNITSRFSEPEYSIYGGVQMYLGGALYFSVSEGRKLDFFNKVFAEKDINLSTYVSIFDFILGIGKESSSLNWMMFHEQESEILMNVSIQRGPHTMQTVSKEKLKALMEGYGFSYFNLISSFDGIFDSEDELIKNISMIAITVDKNGIKDISVTLGVR